MRPNNPFNPTPAARLNSGVIKVVLRISLRIHAIRHSAGDCQELNLSLAPWRNLPITMRMQP